MDFTGIHTSRSQSISRGGGFLRLMVIYRRERLNLVHHFTTELVIHGSLAARLARVGCRVYAIAGVGYIFVGTDLRAKLLRPLVSWILRFSLVVRRSRTIFQNHDDLDFCVSRRIVTTVRFRLILGSGVDTNDCRPNVLSFEHCCLGVLMATR